MSNSAEFRRRLLLRFALLGCGTLLAVGAGLWLGYSRSDAPMDAFVISGLVAAFAILGLFAWAILSFDDAVAKPLLRFAGELRGRARADVGSEAELIDIPSLGPLPEAANEALGALQVARSEKSKAVAKETEKVNRHKALFEALLHDLVDGVLILTADYRVMLYNLAAQGLLPGLGLDRPIANFLRDEPLLNAFKRMSAMRDRGHIDTVEFLVASEDGKRFFMTRAESIFFEDDTLGTVLIFRDATDDFAAHADHDHQLNTLLENVRRRAGGLQAISDVLQLGGEMADDQRTKFHDAMHSELDALCTALREIGTLHDASMVSHWPTSEVASIDIYDGLNAKGIVGLRMSGKSQFTTCDGFATVGLFARILSGLTEAGNRYDFSFAAEPRGDQVWLSLSWSGEAANEGDIDVWLNQPLAHGYGDYSGRDVLLGHRTDVWSEVDGTGYRITMPLMAAHEPGQVASYERAEFYDFDLPPISALGDMANVPLTDLRYVVFDTETTGLEPAKGDEIIQIAGLRIVNNRILHGEVFDTLVDPKRSIPTLSTDIHGITEDMVVGAPDIAKAGRDFHDFCQGAVLVAHNAPFDMAFLKKKQDEIGVSFDQPVLCTVLLSAALYDFADSHTLDALTERLGVEIPPNMRHTAIGDTTATAQVFVRLIEVMQGQGITTLGAAMDAANRMVNYRKAQEY